MNKERAVAAKGGNGLLTAGIVIALLIAAGIYIAFRDNRQWDAAQVEAVVKPAGQAAQIPDQVGKGKREIAPNDVPKSTKEAAPEATSQEVIAQASVAAETDDIGAPQQAPTVDEIRIDEGGVMIVAGRAAPGSHVDVLIDGEIVSSASADPSGAFATLGTLSPNEAARILTVRTGEGDASIASSEDIILAPVLRGPSQAGTATDQAQGANGQIDPAALAAPFDQVDQSGSAVNTDDETKPAGDLNVAGLVEDVRQLDVLSGVDPVAAPPKTEPADLEAAATGVAVLTGDANSATQSATDTPALHGPDGARPPEGGGNTEIAVLRSDDSGVSLIQTAPIGLARVALDTIGYNDEGIVQLAGRAGYDAAEVRVYIDNRAVATLPVLSGGTWRGEVPGVSPGVYKLRVDSLSSKGVVTSRIETPFKREAPSVLSAATKAQGNLVQAVTVQTGDTLWAIARSRYGEGLLYVQVFDANRHTIRDPDLIYPGQVFELPAD